MRKANRFYYPITGPIVVMESEQAPAKLMGWEPSDPGAFDSMVEAGLALYDSDPEVDQILRARKGKIISRYGAGPRPFTWNLERELVAEGRMELQPIHIQDTGNCVAAAIEELMERRQVTEIALFREEESFRPVFTPWVYAVSRNQIGEGRLGNGAGSMGSWGARAVAEYGILFADEEGCPGYSGTSDRWGSSRNARGTPEYSKFYPAAAKHKAKIVKLSSVEKVLESLEAGIMVSIASMQGFSVREYKGFHCFKPSGSWAHQMHYTDCLRDPFVGLYRGNQWGANAHGAPLNGERPGGAWHLAEDLEKEMRSSSVEVYGFYDFEGEETETDPGIL